MEWFKRAKEGLVPQRKKELPDGLWVKCDSCGEIIYRKELDKELWVCSKCDHHFRIRSKDYINLIADNGEVEEYDADLTAADPLEFKDSKRYSDRIKASQKKVNLKDAIVAGIARIEGKEVSFAVMDFGFIGGSMGSVVGEKVARAIERSLERRIPLVIVSCSGGARMQEGILSLMQMAKTSALLAKLYDQNIPYISVLTNPTTAGVMASYASLGDVIMAEPRALLGFAGPRVIQQTIKQDLPPGFQSSEFFLEHGFLDVISHRKDLKKNISLILQYLS